MINKEVQKIADLLKALGEFNRLSLVYKLCSCQNPQNAMCLCRHCSVDASVASRHLKLLKQEKIVTLEKNGRERTYALNREYVSRTLRVLADKIENNKGENDESENLYM